MRENVSLCYCIFALYSSNPDDTTWDFPRAATIFHGLLIFLRWKNTQAQKNWFYPWTYCTSTSDKHLFICFALSPPRKLTILASQFCKLHGSKYKVLNLNLAVFGWGEHVLAEQIVIVCFMNTVFQDMVPWEQRRAQKARAVWAATGWPQYGTKGLNVLFHEPVKPV